MNKDGKTYTMIWKENSYNLYHDKINCKFYREGDKIEYFYVKEPEYTGFVTNNLTESAFCEKNNELATEYAKNYQEHDLTFFDKDNKGYTIEALKEFNKKFKGNSFCKIIAVIENGQIVVKKTEITARNYVVNGWQYIDSNKRDMYGFVRENNVEFFIKPIARMSSNIEFSENGKCVYLDTPNSVNKFFESNFEFPVLIDDYNIIAWCFEKDLDKVKTRVEAELKKVQEKKQTEKIARFANMKPSVKKGMRTKLLKKINSLRSQLMALETEYDLLND